MTGRDIAIELTDIWDELGTSDINTMLAKNISFELLEYFAEYTKQFTGALPIQADQKTQDELQEQLPNLMILGYLIRLLEERVD